MERGQWTRRTFLAAGLAAATTSLRAAVAANYQTVVLAKKPIGYWRLGEDKGPVAADAAGGKHPGTYHGAPAFRERGAVTGDADAAVRLDGRRSYVEVPGHEDFSQPT